MCLPLTFVKSKSFLSITGEGSNLSGPFSLNALLPPTMPLSLFPIDIFGVDVLDLIFMPPPLMCGCLSKFTWCSCDAFDDECECCAVKDVVLFGLSCWWFGLETDSRLVLPQDIGWFGDSERSLWQSGDFGRVKARACV